MWSKPISLGYAARNVPSPYIWSGTDQYKSGKYVRDHVYDPAAIDVQLGCAGLLLAMAALDRNISLDGKMPPITSGDNKPAPTDLHDKDNEPNLGPEPPAQSFATAFVRLLAFLLSLFKRKGK